MNDISYLNHKPVVKHRIDGTDVKVQRWPRAHKKEEGNDHVKGRLKLQAFLSENPVTKLELPNSFYLYICKTIP